ncbi:hypothetical protein J4423_02090 [Candidatus Pacearchaeota archaeon]|nr:hypothetical protein [Candidatus Pacearchaeota archaeon]
MNKQIIFFEPKLAGSTFKMARALKLKNNYETILITFTKPNKQVAELAFDKILYLDIKLIPTPKNLFNIFRKFTKKDTYNFINSVKKLNPYIVQIRGGSLEVILFLLIFKRYPRIYYLQDIWQYYYKKIIFSLRKDTGILQPLNALISSIACKMVDGILNRSGENSLDHLKNELKLKTPILDFLPYCLDEWVLPIRKRAIKKSKEIHLVYAGTIWNKWKGHASFPDMIKRITNQNLHFHLYPSTKNEKLIDIFKNIEKKDNFFHLYNRVDEDKINEIIKNYDYALHLDFYDGTINSLWYATGMSAKIFGYIEAGLPIIINKQFKNMCNIIEENNIGFGINYKDLDNLNEKIYSHKHPSKMDFIKVRKKYGIDRNIIKLERFYDKIHEVGIKRVNKNKI